MLLGKIFINTLFLEYEALSIVLDIILQCNSQYLSCLFYSCSEIWDSRL